MLHAALPLGFFLLLSPALRAQDVRLELPGSEHKDHYGWKVASPGDVDGDGVNDVAMTARAYDSAAGSVKILSGVDGREIRTLQRGTSSYYFGWALAPAGDVDRDGEVDVIVGDFWDRGDAYNAGRVWVFSGKDASVLHEFSEGAPHANFGSEVAGGVDLNADGTPEILAGAFLADIGGDRDTGSLSVYDGATGTRLRRHSGTANSRMGSAIAFVGDLDGDQVPDYAVDHPFNAGPGEVFVYSGATGATIHHIVSPATSNAFGTALAGPGDLSGDGVPDLAIGSWGDSENTDGQGVVWIYSGADGSVVDVMAGRVEATSFGYELSVGGDFDQDGFNELLVGTLLSDEAAIFSGESRRQLYYFSGDGTGLGRSLASMGDLDGDGVPELVAGYPLENSLAYSAGAIRIFGGNAFHLQAEPRTVFPLQTLTLTAAEGDPGQPAMLILREVDGVEVYVPLLGIRNLDGDGHLRLQGTIPVTTPAMDLGFEVLTRYANGALAFSWREPVLIR